ncbi:MAG: S1 RNA-binding domain-containing protein [Pyrinomonadaceae bacterium]|nr:S1 RNA-binding domain-containing protein [Pyrinomonadaceae bacterium]
MTKENPTKPVMIGEETTKTAETSPEKETQPNVAETINAETSANTVTALQSDDVKADVSSTDETAEQNEAASVKSDDSAEDVEATSSVAPETTTQEPVGLIAETESTTADSSDVSETASSTENPAAETTEIQTESGDDANVTTATNVEDKAVSDTQTDKPAKKEAVVVRKLKLNPKATPPPPRPKSVEVSNQKSEASATVATTGASATKTAPKKPVRAVDEEQNAESGMDFGAMLEQFEQEQARFREGELVHGTVVGVSERGVLVSFGYKSEGVVPQAEFLENGEITVKTGDEVDTVIKSMNGGDGLPELSYSEAVKLRTWDDLERASQDGTIVKGHITERVKGGYNVDIKGVEAFMPASQVDSRPPRNADIFVGQDIEARVIKYNRKRGNIVLSRKVILDEINGAQKQETLAQISEGYIVEGKIKSLTDYGAFVDLGGIDGLLHVTDMSWGKIDRPSDMFKPGDDAQVKVLKIDRDKERISLSYRQLIPDPWQSVEERYEIESRHKGIVSSITDYGAFVELESGIEGLVEPCTLG